ncbi:MAG: UTP--glucose-1-phosphate uridylyltransferase [Patescibacteria group bacterium]|jgi:UTP--glucose-1-phosphate uridylyltransferase
MKVKKAIIPVAGLGTRFLPAAKAQPKEMLAVVDKPIIQYIVEEAVNSGIEEIIFVTSYGKRAIEDHFDRNFELEYRLEQKNKLQELETIRSIGKLAKFAFVRQAKPLGDGHALLSAIPFVGPDEPVAILFGDDIFDAKVPGMRQLLDTYEEYEAPVIGLIEVPHDQVSRYGVVGGEMIQKNVLKIDIFVEKPKAEDAPSNFIAPGHYVITPEIMNILKTQEPGKDGEIRLADAFVTALKQSIPMYGKVMKGNRLDCGNKLGFLRAQVELGLKHPEIGEDFKQYLEQLMK